MGNRSSNNQNVKISIETQYSYYNSGSNIKGIVCVNALDNSSYQAIYIRIEGQEKCLWYEGSSKNRKRYYGFNEFFHEDFVLAKFEDKILPKGTYAWPFSIQTSENLPGSFESNATDQTYIRYKLKAYLVDYTHVNAIVQCQIPLNIRQIHRIGVSALQGEMESMPISCFCVESGSIRIRATIARNVYFIGQSVEIQIAIDNDESTKDVAHVQIQLVQNLFVTSNCGATRTFKTILSSATGQGIKANNNISYNLSIPIEKTLEQSTSLGTLVANYYTLQMTAIIGGLCKSLEPYINCPIHIINREPIAETVNQYTPTGTQQIQQMQILKCQPFYFRHNKRLAVMNFQYSQ